MSWSEHLTSLATWALQSEDLRHRFLNADDASEVSEAPGIVWCLETAAVLSIYEAALGKGYKWQKTIDYERPYPGHEGKNPKRADLAFKDKGTGKNWAYVEVKCYGANGKSAVASDIKKLKSIELRSQRWMLVYRIRALAGSSTQLSELLSKNFDKAIEISEDHCSSFRTFDSEWEKGICEICLFRII